MDYEEEALGHVILQYRQSPKLLATVSALVANTQALEDCAVQIPPLDDPDIATGVNLDVTGELVGQGRVLINGTVSSDEFFSQSLIPARILRNNSICSSPEYIQALETVVFVGTPFRYYDLGGLTVGIEVPGEPSGDQVALLDGGPIPRAGGVGVVRVWFVAAGFFGFQGDPRPGLDGYGLKSNLSLGGRYGMLF